MNTERVLYCLNIEHGQYLSLQSFKNRKSYLATFYCACVCLSCFCLCASENQPYISFQPQRGILRGCKKNFKHLCFLGNIVIKPNFFKFCSHSNVNQTHAVSEFSKGITVLFLFTMSNYSLILARSFSVNLKFHVVKLQNSRL